MISRITQFIHLLLALMTLTGLWTIWHAITAKQQLIASDFYPIEIERMITGSASIDGSLLIGLLAFIFTIIGLFVGGAYFYLKKHFEELNDLGFSDTQNLAQADTKISMGMHHMSLYESLYRSSTKSSDPGSQALKQIEKALAQTWHAHKCLESIKKFKEGERYLSLKMMTLNNLIYFTSRKWSYYKENLPDAEFKSMLEKGPIDHSEEYRKDKSTVFSMIKIIQDCQLDFLGKKFTLTYLDTEKRARDTFSVSPEIPPRDVSSS